MAAEGFKIRHNITAMFSHRNAIRNNGDLNSALERLSSGYKINRASDDAAGLAISEKLRSQVRGYTRALQNIQDGISMIQSAEAGLSELHAMLQRMRELSVQSSNGSYTDSDRSMMQLEIDQLLNEINRMQTSVEFNRMKLLDGSFASGVPTTALPSGSLYRGSLVFQVGPNAEQRIRAFISTLSVQGLGLQVLFSSSSSVQSSLFLPTGSTYGGISTQSRAESAIALLDSAISQISATRADLGAYQNRLQHTLNYAGTIREQIQIAESRVRDTDMAEEIIKFTQSQVLVQAANAMLSQANLLPQNVLALLG